jgi:DNA modification methylase
MISCKFFTHSTEFLLWARKSKKVSHYYNYELMKEINGGTQMRDLWTLPAIARWEKLCGKHPTQKPLPLLARIILASTHENEWILDPFTGSSTTGIAASLLGRKFVGIDKEKEYVELSKRRRIEIEDPAKREEYRNRIARYNNQPLLEIQEI